VNCETQDEIDHFWQNLSAGGRKVECGWLKDKFGVSWQAVPTILGEMLQDKDPENPKRVMAAPIHSAKHTRDGPTRHRKRPPRATEGRRTMGESNGAIIRKAYQDFANGNIPAVFAAFDATIRWHVPGHSPLSGDFTGHAQVEGFFRRTMELSGGAFSIDVHNVLADDDLVIALVTVNAQRNGIPASFPEVHVWRLKNGKATEFREYQGDEQREDRFWS